MNLVFFKIFESNCCQITYLGLFFKIIIQTMNSIFFNFRIFDITYKYKKTLVLNILLITWNIGPTKWDKNCIAPLTCLTVATGAKAKNVLILVASILFELNPAKPIVVPYQCLNKVYKLKSWHVKKNYECKYVTHIHD